MNDRYTEILNTIKKESIIHQQKKLNDKILLVDGLNLYIRCFLVTNIINSSGIHIGGIVGFLRSIGNIIKLHQPTRCIVVFDGRGGSYRKRAIYPQYKCGRKTTFSMLDDSSLKSDSMKQQLKRLVEYLDNLSILTIIQDNVEADDVITYISSNILRDYPIIIVSTDNDFFQLINENISVWNIGNKKLYDSNTYKNEYKINPNNHIILKIFEGDKSDNIDGIRGIGITTAIKYFPKIINEYFTVDELIDFSEKNISVSKIYKTIVDTKEIIKRNFLLMKLDSNAEHVTNYIKTNICDMIESNKIEFNSMLLKKLHLEDKLYEAIPNFDLWTRSIFGNNLL